MSAQLSLNVTGNLAGDQKTVAERKWQAGMKPATPQQACDHGLFGDGSKQPELPIPAAPPRGELGETELLALFADIGREVERRCLRKRPCLSSWSTVLDYLRSQIAFAPIEHFRVLYLDKRNQLIADEHTSTGTVDHCPVYPREVIKRALALNASAIILAHNHPSGDPTPSRADIEMTRAIDHAGRPLGIAVHDHIVVGRDGQASLKALKLI